MEQMVVVVLLIAMVYFSERTRQPIYSILAGLFSFGLALMVVTSTIFFVLLLGLAIYLIARVFVSN